MSVNNLADGAESAEMHLHVVASLLRRGKAVDYLSTGMTLLGLALGLSQLWIIAPGLPLTLCVAFIVLCGLAEKYYGLRVAFDADLFSILAQDISRTAEMDLALSALRLQPVDKSGRSWALRSQGALALLRRQILFAALQLLSMLSAFFILPWLPIAH